MVTSVVTSVVTCVVTTEYLVWLMLVWLQGSTSKQMQRRAGGGGVLCVVDASVVAT